VGDKEQSNGTVNVRTRDNIVHGERSVEQVIEMFNTLSKERILKSEEYGMENAAE
jgi:threonyl-tRNA synthetase